MTTGNTTVRYHSLDALRAFVLLLGVVFHAAESFCPDRRSWAIIDRSAHVFFDLFQHVCHSFRMEVFFLIAGFFAHLMLRRVGTAGFLRNRAQRIGVPLVAGWFVFYPLMMLIWMWGKWTSGSLGDLGISAGKQQWNPFQLTAGIFLQGIFLREAFNLVHLWFLYYLLLTYLLLLGIRWAWQRIDPAGGLMSACDRGFARVMRSSWKIPFFALLSLPLTSLMGGGVDTPNKSLLPHGPVLLLYGIFFFTGWLLHRQPEMLEHLARSWKSSLAAGLLFILPICFPRAILHTLDAGGSLLPWARTLHNLTYPLMMWSLALGITGLFLVVRRREDRFWRYVADSSYWLYLVHPVVVVPLQILVADFNVNALLKLLFINAVAFPVVFASYHFLVRSTFIGMILNGRRYPRDIRRENGVISSPATQTNLQTAG